MCGFDGWYIIAEANGEENSEVYPYDLKELAEINKKPESQYFFQVNSIISDKEESLPLLPGQDVLPDFPF
ncbi:MULTISPECIES: hypothetical protein [unclassified Saccharicrinis]|uniref:hypothetical protein n=1 Tax=unclassified Saccharicrinis TaxID=2646859 RepID=UPI003D3502A7